MSGRRSIRRAKILIKENFLMLHKAANVPPFVSSNELLLATTLLGEK